jgi:hypothetical protein
MVKIPSGILWRQPPTMLLFLLPSTFHLLVAQPLLSPAEPDQGHTLKEGGDRRSRSLKEG